MFGMHTCTSGMAITAAAVALAAIAPPALGEKTHQYDGGAILIPAGAPGTSIGPAAPYPSTVTVSGLTAPIGEVKVRLNGLSHTFLGDLDVLLVGPGGQTALLLNHVGEGSPGVVDADYLFVDDGAAVPANSPPPSGRYHPTQLPVATNFPSPTPLPPYGTTLAGFRGTDPNGTWSLYIQDRGFGDVGDLDGWSLIITEKPSVVNSRSIAIPAMGTNGPGDPYPSTVVVDGMDGAVQSVSVMLLGLAHAFPVDCRFLLEGPSGQNCLLYSQCGDGSDVVGVNLVIDDAAAANLPEGPLVSGTFRPTACFGTAMLNFNAPAPAAPYGATLSVFNGTNPNGVWRLYTHDVGLIDIGTLAGGWALIINGQVCPADFNHSGAVSVQDIFDFLAAYFAGCP